MTRARRARYNPQTDQPVGFPRTERRIDFPLAAKTYVCDACFEQIPAADLKNGSAREIDGEVYCAECVSLIAADQVDDDPEMIADIDDAPVLLEDAFSDVSPDDATVEIPARKKRRSRGRRRRGGRASSAAAKTTTAAHRSTVTLAAQFSSTSFQGPTRWIWRTRSKRRWMS